MFYYALLCTIRQKKDIIKYILELKRKNKINTAKSSEIKNKNYYHYDDTEYKGIRDVKDTYDDVDEDYYKPIRIGNAFSSNYIEYKSNGDKDKILLIKEYLDMIRPYLNDLIDKHKTQGESKIN